jgi:microcystin-dependent protein
MFGGNFAPVGWMFCNGQILSISEYDALNGLIGTTYGGDGVTTFALPDLRGRVPIHQGSGYALGQAAGIEDVTLTPAQMPAHTHMVVVSDAAVEGTNPSGAVFATSADTPFYAPFNGDKAAALNPAVLGSAGGSEPHENMQPYLCVSFIIAVEGIYPQS